MTVPNLPTDPNVYLGSADGIAADTGFFAISKAAIVAGVQSLATMRGL